MAIFLIGLVLSSFIVSMRRRIKLSEQISLEPGGISVSLPDGWGWEIETWQFNFQENSYTLTAFLKAGGQLSPIVQWRYLLASEKHSLNEIFAKEQADIVDSGQISCQGASIEWAQIQAGGIKDVFFGLAVLGHGRILEIKVIAPGDEKLAEYLFTNVAPSLTYTPNYLLAEGQRLVRSAKDAGVEYLTATSEAEKLERFFLVNADDGTPVGIMAEHYTRVSDPQNWARLRVEEMNLSKGRKGWETQISFFECNEKFDQFTWKSIHNMGRSVIELQTDGRMNVTGIGRGSENNYWPGPAAIPATLLDSALALFVGSYQNQMIVDVLFSNGMIIPTKVSKTDAEKIKGFDGQVWYAVRLDFLYGNKSYREVYFDKDKHVIGGIERGSSNTEWQKTSRKGLSEAFGEDITELLK